MENSEQNQLSESSTESQKVSRKMNAIYFAQFALLLIFGISMSFPVAITNPASNTIEASGLFLFGWLGILGGYVSWYWFIPTILYFRSLRSERCASLTRKKKIIYFAIPLIGLVQAFFAIHLGQPPFPGDIGGRESKIESYGTAFYLYIEMVVFVLTMMSISNIISDRKKIETWFTISTIVFLTISLVTILLTK